MKFKRNTIVVFNTYTQTVLDQVEKVWKRLEGTEPVLTSGLDGTHGENSFHYQGRAWDFRLPVNVSQVVTELQKALTVGYFDVILEGDHIHIEYDPK